MMGDFKKKLGRGQRSKQIKNKKKKRKKIYISYSFFCKLYASISVNTFLIDSVLTSKNLITTISKQLLQLVGPIGASKKGIRKGEE